jgi:pseudouridine-5'-monophosphatase
MFDVFPPSQKVLGDDERIPKGRGKPMPDIYELALETVNAGLRQRGEQEVARNECLVFEDSVPGVEAGRRAGMRVIWCPHPGLIEEYKGRYGEVLAGLTGSGSREEGMAEETKKGGGWEQERKRELVEGWPGKLDDGWAEFLPTLEGFPYEKYGIQVKGS